MKERFTFFLRGPFSQWYRSPFTVEGVYYNTAEQFMMAEKARLFGDAEMLVRIMAAKEPRDQKALGRLVRGFDLDVWTAHAQDIVRTANRAKFTTHRDLLQLLLDTAGTTLVEANPVEPIWGIGLAENNPYALDRKMWRGTNFLGQILTDLRESLMAELAAGGIPELEDRRARKSKARAK